LSIRNACWLIRPDIANHREGESGTDVRTVVGGIAAIAGHNFWERLEFTPAVASAPGASSAGSCAFHPVNVLASGIQREKRMRRCSMNLLLALVLASTLPGSAHAQITPGQRIRVAHGRQRIVEGVYLGIDSLRYALILNGADTVRIPLDGGYSAERSIERNAGDVIAKGASIGTRIGLGIGVTLEVLNPIVPSKPPIDQAAITIISLFVTGVTTTVGLVVGAIVAVGDHDVWLPVTFTTATGVAGTTAP